MNVVFWSPVEGKCAVSSSMMATAMNLSLTTDSRCCILPMNCKNRGAQNALISREGEASLSKAIGNFGIDALLMSTAGGFNSAEELQGAALNIHQKLDYFTASTNPRTTTVERTMLDTYDELLVTLMKAYDLVFVDAGAGYSELAMKAMESADLIVVCLRQELETLNYFQELCDMSNIACVYLFTDYEADVKLNLTNICKKFPKLKPAQCMKLGHCAEFANAINDSRAVKFFYTNCSKAVSGKAAPSHGKTDGFIADLGKVAKAIQKRMEAIA